MNDQWEQQQNQLDSAGDIILPGQVRHSAISGEQEMVYQALATAIEDLHSTFLRPNPLLYAEVMGWLMASRPTLCSKRNDFFSFAQIAEYLGIDEDYIRKKILAAVRRWKETQGRSPELRLRRPPIYPGTTIEVGAESSLK